MSPAPSRNSPAILCVVGDPALSQSIRASLSPTGAECVDVADAQEAISACMATRPELVIVDCGVDAVPELATELAGGDARSRIPWIAIGTAAQCQIALRLGASDWTVTPIADSLFAHRVISVLRSVRVERDLASTRFRLAADEAAAEASISGSPPRERFLQRTDEVLRNPRTKKSSAALVMLSAEVADAQADASLVSACLATLTKRLRDMVRSREGSSGGAGTAGPVTLLEGSEFSVLLERQERPQEAYKVARRLQQQLEKPVEIDGRKCSVQVNAGIAVHLHDGTTATELYESARKAMGRARQEQLHGIRFATAAMNSSTFERLTLESNLRYALERGELTPFYQPRVDIRTGNVVGFEALLRWKHPELGMVSPAQFIPIAEESGLIVPIGEWVMREACRQNQAWRAAGLPHVRMAVNLSSVQFRQPDLELRIARVLEETGLDPDGLELELTESMLLQDADATIETLRTIRHMGIHMSIDDFGTGYSSLNYIKRFPVNALKIDQSFVRELLTSPEDSAITTSVVLMGKSLNLTVVAEGVETRSQLEFLRALECDEAQGYLFSRPVPAQEAGECLQRGYASVLGLSPIAA